MAVSRVIEVSFGRSSVALVRIDTAYFYNNGILFKPTDIDLPASYQVHWADSPQASSTLETIGTAEGAPIPDDLWNRSRVIYGWIYLHPTEDSGITYKEVRIYKNVRAGLPDGTEPTPAEQSTIDQLIGALNGAVERAEDAEQAIEDMSVSATTLVEGASATVTKSEQDGVVHLAFGIPKGATGDDGYSPTANVSKTGKVATITITDKNGTTSAQVEDGEDGTDGIDGISPSVSVTDITGGHRVVITDKDGTKSFDVEDGATGATPNLTIGTVETLEPTESATATITGTPENPVLNLGIPQGEQGEVTLEDYYKAFPTDTASGSIASFSDGADDLPLKSLVVDINPIQDLHGQDAPYPAGGGKNKFDPNSANHNWVGTNGAIMRRDTCKTCNIPIASGTSVTLSNANASSATNILLLAFFDSNDTLLSRHPLSTGATYITATAPENTAYVMASFFTWSEASYAQLELGSTATSYAPYENLCPISGWTECEVNATGYNVWDEEWELGSINFTKGIKQNSSANIRSKNYIPVIGGATYYGKAGTLSSSACVVFFYTKDKTYISNAYCGNTAFTVPSNAKYALFYCGSAYGTTYNHDISINYPSTDHSYHPYTGRSITIDLGQTVYGGKLDVLSGELVIDRAMVDLGILNWKYSAAGTNHERFTYADSKLLKGSICLCDILQTVTYSDMYNHIIDNSIAVHPNAQQVEAYVSAYTDVNSFKTAMSGSQFCYELATPITVTLTPNELSTLLGANNIWSDAGEVTAEYRADPTLYIQRLTEPDADMVADSNITSGSYFMVGNTLYKATANIASGATISPNVNCTRKSLSEALNELNS